VWIWLNTESPPPSQPTPMICLTKASRANSLLGEGAPACPTLRDSLSPLLVSKVGSPLGLDHVGSNPIAFRALDSKLELPQALLVLCFSRARPREKKRLPASMCQPSLDLIRVVHPTTNDPGLTKPTDHVSQVHGLGSWPCRPGSRLFL
jgi:hypothetical protein